MQKNATFWHFFVFSLGKLITLNYKIEFGMKIFWNEKFFEIIILAVFSILLKKIDNRQKGGGSTASNLIFY